VPPELLTLYNIDALSALEPCGNGCPKPVLVMEKLIVDRISLVGGGRHMRLRLRQGRHGFNAIYFSATPQSASVAQGEMVDVAFSPQINEFRGERSVQMNILDIRPACKAECSALMTGYKELCAGCVGPEEAKLLLPDRNTLGMIWRYLAGLGTDTIQESPMCLCRKIVRWTGMPLSLGQMLTCLDIFADVGLLQMHRYHKYITIRLMPRQEKADLASSQTMQRLTAAKES
jgi:single-stranded-DNA-specific exonuclease